MPPKRRLVPTIIFTAAAALAIGWSSAPLACRLPSRIVSSPQDLLGAPGRVVLAEVVAIDRAQVVGGLQTARYRFSTLEVLRGEVPSSFELGGGEETGVSSAPASAFYLEGQGPAADHDFNGHRIMDSGRTPQGGSCKYDPYFVSFKKERRYLIFLDHVAHPWGSERIVVDDDRWLLEVRSALARNPG
jgi:hypothetical protein